MQQYLPNPWRLLSLLMLLARWTDPATAYEDDAFRNEGALTFTMGPDPAVAEAPDAEVVVDAALLPPSEIEVTPAEEEATVEVAMVVESDPAALEEPPPLSDDTVQSLTSFTCGCPSTVIGVSVILQVSVTGPLELPGKRFQLLNVYAKRGNARINLCDRCDRCRLRAIGVLTSYHTGSIGFNAGWRSIDLSGYTV